MTNELENLRHRVAELEAENERLTKALHQSEEWFRKIFHASSNMMAIHTVKEGRFVDVNDAAASFGGFTREELIGHTMEDRRLMPDSQLDSAAAGKLADAGRFHNLEMKMRTKQGEVRTVLASLDPITMGNEPCLLAVSIDITEREAKADALRQSEEKYRMLVENSLQGLAIIQNSRIVFCNHAYAAMWGYSIEELLSFSPDEISAMTHPNNRVFIRNHLSDQLADNPVPSRFEHQGIRKDGSAIWMEVNISVIDYNGKPAIQSVCMDITERKKAENALRESEERFRLIAETIDEIFWIYDAEKKIATYLSPAYDRIWGIPRETAVNRKGPSLEPTHPDDLKIVANQVNLMSAGQPINYEYRILRPDGSIRHIWDRGFPVRDKNGRITRYVGVGQDVTEWRHAEEALKESKEYMNQIINCIGDPIFVKDRQHRFVHLNDAMCAFIGKPRKELLAGAGIPEDPVAKPFWEQEEYVFNSGQESLSEDTLPDGQGILHTFMTKKSLLTDKSGNKQVVGVLRDITEYKHLEAQFLQSQKMEAIGVLAGGVAHDFNNLLNVIDGYAELILDELEPGHPMRNDVEHIRDAGQRATTLTSQLLAFSRKQIMQPEIIDLERVIVDMSAMLRRMIGEDVELISRIQPDPIIIHADPGKIQQVIMNLVVNARDAMPNGGKLTIEASNVDFGESYIKEHPVAKPGRYVMLAISDTGIGMDSETQARIFEPFFTTKEKGKGTGLGMSTVYGIVKQSDGFVWVYSEPGKGTTVKTYFPRVTSRIPSSQPEIGLDPGFRGSETILIVEDEAAVRTLASRILRERGYRVLEAADGTEALRIAQEYQSEIHMVLTDVVMPGVGGKALIARLEELRPGIHALYISGYTDNAIVHHGILDSGVAFLQKPFSVDSLLRKVREVLTFR